MVLIMPVSPPENGLLYTANNIKLKVDQEIIGQGTVYISQDTLSWQPADLPDGISIQWKQVSLHGISSNPRKCIYFMLDHKVLWPVATNGLNGEQPPADANDDDEGNGSDEDDEDNFEDAVDEQEVTECWLLPEDIHTVDTMYRAMTTCQALHPDSADSDSDESENMEDAYAGGVGMAYDQDMGDGTDDALGHNNGEVGGMQNLSLEDDERFEDADE